MENLALTESTYYILLSLYHPQHGYGIMQQTEQLSGGRVHLAAGTLAFDPVHDLGKFPTVEDEGKAPIPGVDTLPSL